MPVAFTQIPGLEDAMGGLSMFDIRLMLKAQWEARRALEGAA